MKKTAEIIKELRRFKSVDEEPLESNELLLDTIVEDFFENEDAYLVIPTLFELLENHPDADFGALRTIVHTFSAVSGVIT
ncbi:hypothetical protein [Adhaeribacter rhizoryzae]|uniref:Uncharacterized protein n=1 Tax=Adhaeribacter rhizoryzae TaxID=2607907 RepID=A0A5M6D026_9BACT|nr:hypothetical protein [Adhaeribacter rhizoryzae]KAA5540828.1 hypothetical protein F0145_22235 [Adhaeribacter rhizoryzae]